MTPLFDIMPIPGGVTAPDGFSAGGFACGIRKEGRLDLALVRADAPCAAAALFTTNRVKAHPVIDGMEKLAAGNRVTAVLVNSGSANACTGPEGRRDLERMIGALSEASGIKPDEILMSSTGVIGERIPVERVTAAFPGLLAACSPEGHEVAARAIMTTDTRPKEYAIRVETPTGAFTVGGMAKGAGMINPNMATMLCFLTTDAAVTDRRALKRALRGAVSRSFNCLDLDVDTSTNDTVLIMASGRSGFNVFRGGTEAFQESLDRVCTALARMIAADMEGATKLVTVSVTGARTGAQAEAAARAVAESPLVKTALHGEDPNWGRIMAALGRSGARFDESAVNISFNGLPLVTGGVRNPAVSDREARIKLSVPKIDLVIELGKGDGDCRILSGDLTADYVAINASYRS